MPERHRHVAENDRHTSRSNVSSGVWSIAYVDGFDECRMHVSVLADALAGAEETGAHRRPERRRSAAVRGKRSDHGDGVAVDEQAQFDQPEVSKRFDRRIPRRTVGKGRADLRKLLTGPTVGNGGMREPGYSASVPGECRKWGPWLLVGMGNDRLRYRSLIDRPEAEGGKGTLRCQEIDLRLFPV